jgi:hypothetical protein
LDVAEAAEAVDVLAGRLGWQGYPVCLPPSTAELAPLTVKAATTLQFGRADFVACALAAGAAPVPAAEVQSALQLQLRALEVASAAGVG